MDKIRIASRHSELALWQANSVGQMLEVEYEIVEVTTRGDSHLELPISSLGANGAFVKEVQLAVLNGDADIAVHSAKDLPSETLDGLVLASFPIRGDVRDVMIGSSLEDLKFGARVATGSARRRAQLASLRPDLQFFDLRGNIGTRLEKSSNFDAIVLANAALQRLEKDSYATQVLSVSTVLPQVGQGALAVECRSDDSRSIALVGKINDRDTMNCVLAERAFLHELGGGCSIPCAAYATSIDSENIWIRALLAEPFGRKIVRSESKGKDFEKMGSELARDLLDNKGGNEIMEMVS